jgi:signal peptidase I
MVLIVVALLAALVVKTWVLPAYVIPSGSMEPTIQIGDRVLVDKLAFDFRAIHRGDIIVFAKPPADTESGGIHDPMKRVIGLPGEALRSGPDGEIFVDGKLVAQPWVTAATLDALQPTICDRALVSPASIVSATRCTCPKMSTTSWAIIVPTPTTLAAGGLSWPA